MFPSKKIAQMIFQIQRRGIIQNFTKDIDHGLQYIEKFRGGVQWYLMESKCFSNMSFKLKNENSILVRFGAQSINFIL